MRGRSRDSPLPLVGSLGTSRDSSLSSVCALLAGDMYEIGAEKGKHYSVNVPLKDGIDDQSESCDSYASP